MYKYAFIHQAMAIKLKKIRLVIQIWIEVAITFSVEIGKLTLKKISRQHLRSLQNQSQPNLIIPNPDLNMKGILLHLTFQSVSAICFLNQYIDERIAANSKYRWTDIENTLLIATKKNTQTWKSLKANYFMFEWMGGKSTNWDKY